MYRIQGRKIITIPKLMDKGNRKMLTPHYEDLPEVGNELWSTQSSIYEEEHTFGETKNAYKILDGKSED
jgi:hypothetical protein